MRTDDDVRARLQRRIDEVSRTSSGSLSSADLEKFTAFAALVIAPVLGDFLVEQREQLRRVTQLVLATERARRNRELVYQTERADADD